MPKIKDLPKIERPREKLIAKGSENLKDEELLVIKNLSKNRLWLFFLITL